MTIYLNENQKHVLKKLLSISEQSDNKKRLHFKKSDIEDIFTYDLVSLREILATLKACRLIDVPFENNMQIDIYIYREMIEEQLQINTSYVRRYKEYVNEEFRFSSKPLAESIKEELNEEEYSSKEKTN